MNTKAFMAELDRQLSRMSTDERNDVLYDYEEHIRIAMENGKSEEEAVNSLGSPRAIAKELLADYYIHRAEDHQSVRNVGRAVFASISLGFFNLIFVSGPFFAAVGVLIGLFGAALGLMVGPLVAVAGILIGAFQSDLANGWLIGFSLLATEGLGILLFVLSIYIGKLFGKLVLGYLKMNGRLIRGES